MQDVDGTARSTEQPGGGFWGDVRAAIAGTPRDYTRGSVPRAVLLLAVPMVFTAIAVGQCAPAAMGVLWFRRGTWKHREI